jgi:uncharacterized protein (DUF697 family)
MTYEKIIEAELQQWKVEMRKSPSLFNSMSKHAQNRINRMIPEKVHIAFTTAIKQMTRAVIFGAELTSHETPNGVNLNVREHLVHERIKFYRNTAAAEGAVTGAAGFLTGLADFPIWLTLKMKMLFEIAGLYGFDVRNYKERIYILYIFQLTFSSQKNRNRIFEILENWNAEQQNLPEDINKFEWRNFQQEYRDYIDIAKLLQLIPGIGAVVGAYVNHRLTEKLGKYAMNAYRMRWPISNSAERLTF